MSAFCGMYTVKSARFRVEGQFNKESVSQLGFNLVAEWIYFTLLGIISPTIKLKVYTFGDNITHYKTKNVHFWGLMNSATQSN